MLIINGTMGPDHGQATVTTNPLPASYGQVGVGDTKYLYNPWVARDAVIYIATLDPAIEYDVSIQAEWSKIDSNDTNATQSVGGIGLHSVTFYSAFA